jgi:hypothetical protein
LAISLVTFAFILGGTLLGLYLATILPEQHVSEESRDAVKLGIGMIATLAALVLALLMASAKGSFDTFSSGLRQAGSRIILLDHVMAHYGPETMEARDLLRRVVASSIERRWPEHKTGPAVAKAPDEKAYIDFLDKLHELSPRTDAQRWLHSRALQISSEISEARWLLIEQMGQTSLPMPFVVMLIFWLTIIFATFGLFSPRNTTVITILIVCALSVAGSLFLIMELDAPYGGLIKASSAPLRNALKILGGIAAGKPQ